MSPTLHTGQLIFIVKIAYTPSHGDIIVFSSPDGLELVKRVIGLPGETVEITDGIVYLIMKSWSRNINIPLSCQNLCLRLQYRRTVYLYLAITGILCCGS